jgi:hypothetical protein
MTVAMSAFGPKQTCRKTQSMSLLGVKRTFAVQMSAFDPKRTCARQADVRFSNPWNQFNPCALGVTEPSARVCSIAEPGTMWTTLFTVSV